MERATVGQSANPLWHRIRRGKITASNVGVIVKCRHITPEFVNARKNPKNISFLPALKWGTQHERRAREDYSALTGNRVRECGIFISNTHEWLGATPDGIVHDTEKDCDGLLEIKCPFSIREHHPIHCFRKLTFTDNNGQLRKSHNYYYQVQTQLYASDYTWCDFVIWTPIGLHVERIYKDESFINSKMLPQLNHFFTRHWSE